jgi:hypothetical protein
MEIKALEHCVCVICIYVIYIYICIYVSYLYLYMYIYICYLYLYMYICVCQMEIKALEHFLWALYVSLICVLICADGDQGAGTLSVGLICVPYMCPYMCRWRSRRWNTFCGPYMCPLYVSLYVQMEIKALEHFLWALCGKDVFFWMCCVPTGFFLFFFCVEFSLV